MRSVAHATIPSDQGLSPGVWLQDDPETALAPAMCQVLGRLWTRTGLQLIGALTQDPLTTVESILGPPSSATTVSV